MALIPDVFPNLRTPKKLVRSMSKKSHFRGPFEKQGSKRTLTLLKFERQHLYHIYWSLWGQLSWKQSLLLICKILRLFVNTVTAVDKYSLLNRDKLTQPIQIQLSQKQKNSSNFLSRFLKSSLNFERFKKKDDPHCWRISIKKRTLKHVVRSMSKKSCFRGLFQKKHGKLVETLLKSERQYLYYNHWSISWKLTYEKSLLVIFKILRLFVNTLTADDKYSLLNIDNSRQPNQMQLSQKQKTFSQIYSLFLKSTLDFEHFQRKDDPPTWCISKTTDSKKRG